MPKKHNLMDQTSEERPQFVEDQRVEPDYSNNVKVSSWLIGGGKRGAEGMPHYDSGKKWFFGPKGK